MDYWILIFILVEKFFRSWASWNLWNLYFTLFDFGFLLVICIYLLLVPNLGLFDLNLKWFDFEQKFSLRFLSLLNVVESVAHCLWNAFLMWLWFRHDFWIHYATCMIRLVEYSILNDFCEKRLWGFFAFIEMCIRFLWAFLSHLIRTDAFIWVLIDDWEDWTVDSACLIRF